VVAVHFDRRLAAQTGRTHGEDHIVLTMTLRLAAAGLLTSVAVATVGAAAARNVTPAPSATERDALLLVAQRSGAPRTPLDTRPPASGWRIGPELEIKPEWVPQKKPQIPQPEYKPAHCVKKHKLGHVGGLVLTPMSQLPPPGLCTGPVLTLYKDVVGSQSAPPPGYGPKTVGEKYCISCKYGGFPAPGLFKVDSLSYYEASQQDCFKCKGNYFWNPEKLQCCFDPKK
jgi:hypothetical protein